jgi:hypothetical protein
VAGAGPPAVDDERGRRLADATLLTPVDPTKVDDMTATVYDGTRRVTASIFEPGSHEA